VDECGREAPRPRGLALRHGTVSYRLRGSEIFTALDSVSLSVPPGRCIGLLGESGSGKSTLGRCLARLQLLTSGELFLDGQRASAMGGRAFHGRVQMVFQCPAEALDPRQSIRSALAEPLRIHFPSLSRSGRERRIVELLRSVRLDGAVLERRPAALSGGQRQRVAIGRALAVGPQFLICDEVVSALDGAAREEILRLLSALRRSHGLAILFISPDPSAVLSLCDRIALLRRGSPVEIFSRAEFIRHDALRDFSAFGGPGRGNIFSSAAKNPLTAHSFPTP
jgi:ABC-type dipeptide/oligopeptide/nickel transport system ATPase subunit